MDTLPLRWLRDLDLETAAAPGRPTYLSAASGLVATGDALYVVADDELHIGRFPLTGSAPGSLQRLFAGELPDDFASRKKQKPDLEVLMLLPPSNWHVHGALLALGSGSKRHRRRGALLPLDAAGHTSAPQEIDATPLYATLERELGGLNLEGGWISGSLLFLLQRGNRHSSQNALIGIALAPLLVALYHERVLPSQPPQLIRSFDLGERGGVPLCFTDGCALQDGGWLFSAVAEDSGDPAEDGQFVGAAIGRVNAAHSLQWVQPTSPQYKIEGISAVRVGAATQLLLVADADNPAVPSSLLSAVLE